MQSMSLVIRTDSKDQAGSVLAARHAIAAVDPELPLFDVRSMERLVFRSLSEPRFNTFLLALFAGLALLLAALGTYGVMACAVTARTREIGLRVALGASRGAVLRQILGRVAAIAGIGSSLGILGATLTAHLLGSQLYEVRPIETATYVSVLLLMIASSLLAGYLPARRAARVDPMEALRYE
jgi:putative ABC transport system permease protein